MNCTEARQHWMLFLDSEGDPELHLRIRGHIGDCSDCSKWFAEQRVSEEQISEAISSGEPTPQLWQRVLSHVQVPPASAVRRRRFALVTALTVAAAVIALLVGYQVRERSFPAELSRDAADWHVQWQLGNVRPELESTSDHEVDHYLKRRVPFRVHCPPRTDVQFSVQGAGVCFMKDQRLAAYIVGSVGNSPVSILVLDKSNLDGFPEGFHHRNEGSYQVASAVIAENVVIVVGTTSLEVLERLLHAYGSYHQS